MPIATNITPFPTAAAFERWLAKHHDRETEIWVRIYKKGSGVPTVTHAEALDVALCWGWIDAIRKRFDNESYLQRYTPRRKGSVWSQINVANVTRLIEAGRMTPHGMREVQAAQADGRWAKAYGSGANMPIPDDLQAAIDADPVARRMLEQLSAQNRFALAFRMHSLKTAAGREKRIAAFVDMLRRGETPHPQKPARTARGPASGVDAA